MRLETLSMSFSDESGLVILDQTQLPNHHVMVPISSLEQMIDAIQTLKVRGAPLIGITASLFWSHWLLKQNDTKTIQEGFKLLRSSRPTAVNLMNNLDSCWEAYQNNPHNKRAALNQAIQLFEQDKALCDQMSFYASSLIQDGDSIVTYCNTGSLATAGMGTALGGIKKAFQDKKQITVYACETRPLGQGARLTLFELQMYNIPSYLI